MICALSSCFINQHSPCYLIMLHFNTVELHFSFFKPFRRAGQVFGNCISSPQARNLLNGICHISWLAFVNNNDDWIMASDNYSFVRTMKDMRLCLKNWLSLLMQLANKYSRSKTSWKNIVFLWCKKPKGLVSLRLYIGLPETNQCQKKKKNTHSPVSFPFWCFIGLLV